jgi:hypothetical protein
MSLKKFGHNDVILNIMKAHPSCEFFIFDGTAYHDGRPIQAGTMTGQDPDGNSIGAVTDINVTGGYVSLYEYNIDRPYVSTDRAIAARVDIQDTNVAGQPTEPLTYTTLVNEAAGRGEPNSYVLDTGRIYAYTIKGSDSTTFKRGVSDDDWNSAQPGTVFTKDYPLIASITREFMSSAAGLRNTLVDHNCGGNDAMAARIGDDAILGLVEGEGSMLYPHFFALKNRLNYYGLRSPHYKVIGTGSSLDERWNKGEQQINLISIPAIFYGSQIKPGSVSLKWYFTGSLAGELRDTRHNGELIEVSGTNTDAVAGVVMYDEGFILLTGSWNLEQGDTKIGLIKKTGASALPPVYPAWLYFGAGANDGVTQSTTSASFNKASFDLSFKGETETQVMTMFAHARRGEVNYSNNPTFLNYGQSQIRLTSSQVYEESPTRTIRNTVSSSYTDYSASFERQVYISRVAIYDDAKNLIGVATLSNPILKEEDQDYSFKIRLDI